MNTITKILSIAVLSVVATIAIAQEENPVDKLNHIVEPAAANCDTEWGVDMDKAQTNYSLYREHAKQENYHDAVIGWKYVFFNSPKGRQTTHLDGVKIYESFAKEVGKEDPIHESYIDTILAIYEVRGECFGITADLKMRKAFAWYKHRNKGHEEFVYNLFTETVAAYDAEGKKNEISSGLLTPWILMAIKAHKTAKVIEADEVLNVYEQISEIADYNMINGIDAGKYKGASDKVFEYLEKYEYLTCENIVPTAEKIYNDNPTDPATAIKVYKMLKSAKCYDAPFFLDVALIVFEEQPSAALAKFIAKKYADAGDYTTAISYSLKGIDLEDDTEEKAKQTLSVADMYRKKGDYSSSRSYAYKAAELKTGWGSPYVLIGRLYASSGSRCGEGTGWDSQVVVWAAIDMWNKAKSIDGSVSTEAQNLINQYYAYMPTKSEIFMRNLNVGSSYSVPCWIGATTTIRSSD